MRRTGLWRGAVAFAMVFAWASGTASAALAAGCPNDALRDQAEQKLPDCRAYEQVSPLDKNGNDVGNHGGPQGPRHPDATPAFVASSDGSRLVFDTLGALPGALSSLLVNANLSQRGSEGWSTQPITAPMITAPIPNLPFIEGYTNDLRHAFVFVPPGPLLPPGATAGAGNLLLRNNDDGSYRTISVGPPGGQTDPAFINYRFAGASTDLRHILFEANDALTPDAPAANQRNLYEYVDGQLRLVTILPDGTPAPLGGAAGGSGGATALYPLLTHVISDDGSRVVFGTSNNGPDGGEIYVREDGQHTVMASASRRTVADPTHSPPTFWGATADGSQVFFTSGTALTNDAEIGSVSLYRFDVDSGDLTNLTPDPNPSSPDTFVVQGVLGTSDDGSYVYFRDNRRHVPGKGVDGSSNLYLWHDGTIHFIATDNSVTTAEFDANHKTNRMAPDGRSFVFASTEPLTGYDNVDAVTGTPDSEVFLYNADSQALTCVSCRPDGSRPTGRATLPIAPVNAPINPQRTVTDDGRRVFFDSEDALVPSDVNGRNDVYQWEGGAVHLISSGRSNDDSFFAASSSSGDDVFFVTREKLVGPDTDEHLDMYDARVGGGFPEPAAPAPCSGDGCQGKPTPPPAARPAPGSKSVSDGGNASTKAKKAATFRVSSVSAAARRTAARKGTITLTVRVSEGGIVTGRVSRKAGRGTATVASKTAYPPRAGTVHLKLRLSKGTRSSLAHGKRMRLSVRVTFSHVRTAKTLNLELSR